MIQGSIVAIVTPMQADGSLDKAALQHLIEFHLAQGTDAIVAVGTTGESATLSATEHCEVIQWAVDAVAKRVPVIAGTGSNSTAEAIEFTRCAQQAGADAALLVTPYYNKPTQEGLYLHFKAIAEAVPLPQILYNVPGRTVCDMHPDTVVRLAQIDNIVGLKDATGDLSRMAKHRAGCGEQFALYSGDDATALAFILQGGHGVISVTANVAPRAMHDLCSAALSGDTATATAINDKLMGLHTGLFVEANPIPVKWAAEVLGLVPANSGIRLPLTRLSPGYHDGVLAALKTAGLL